LPQALTVDQSTNNKCGSNNK